MNGLDLKKYVVPVVIAAAIGLAGCGNGGGGGTAAAVRIDGSSTVFPVVQLLAEDYAADGDGARVTVGESGTGAGFEKLANGEIDVAGASRPIKQGEIENLGSNGVPFIELPIAFDGLSVIVHPENDWLQSISIEQLYEIWKTNPTITRWSDLDPSFPDEEIVLFGPTDVHGTYDYFNETVVGENDDHTQSYQSSAVYSTLVSGVASEVNALGYVGYAYFEENRDKLRVIPVSSEQTGGQPVEPSATTIQSGEYSPLSRPLLVYVRADALDTPSVASFVDFMLQNAPGAVSKVGYIPLPSDVYATALAHVEDRVTGSRMVAATPGMTIEEVLALEASE